MLRAAETARPVSRLTLRCFATPLTVLEKIRSALSRMVITTASSTKVKPARKGIGGWGGRVRCMGSSLQGEGGSLVGRKRPGLERIPHVPGDARGGPLPPRPLSGPLLLLGRIRRRRLRGPGGDHLLDLDRQRERGIGRRVVLDAVDRERDLLPRLPHDGP